MTIDEISQFRITVWPGRKLPVPAVKVNSVVLINRAKHEEFLKYEPGTLEDKEIALPEDFYLRELLDLDLSDSQSILAFSKAFGRLGSPGWKDLPVTGYRRSSPPGLIDRVQKDFLEAFGFTHPLDKVEFVPIEDFKLHAAVLRDIVRIWLSIKGEISFGEMVHEWENGLHPPPQNKSESAAYLEAFLNAGLWPFQAHLTVAYPEDGRPESPFPRFGSPSLFSTVCLQLANDIAENATYRRCANEACGRIFSKQRGRSEYGQYKSSKVIYCSAHCARAQTSRNLRRRQTKARQLHKKGDPPQSIAKEIDTDLETVKRWLGAGNATTATKKKGR